jgi:hypothetical protein
MGLFESKVVIRPTFPDLNIRVPSQNNTAKGSEYKTKYNTKYNTLRKELISKSI